MIANGLLNIRWVAKASYLSPNDDFREARHLGPWAADTRRLGQSDTQQLDGHPAGRVSYNTPDARFFRKRTLNIGQECKRQTCLEAEMEIFIPLAVRLITK